MKYLALLSLVVAAYMGVATVVTAAGIDIQYRMKESRCIAEYISQGVERIDIKTSNGSCEVVPNGYYL